LLAPIYAFTGAAEWPAHEEGIDTQAWQRQIAPNVRAIHAYWLARRDGGGRRQAPPRRAPTVGRNDPCPCGSCKKYKKCCLQ